MSVPCHQPEEDEADRLRSPPLSRPAGKAPSKSVRRFREPDDDEVPERPNLIEIFDEFDVPDDERVLLCATTAAFYRALNKKRKNKD
jgi:hypothetical protein